MRNFRENNQKTKNEFSPLRASRFPSFLNKKKDFTTDYLFNASNGTQNRRQKSSNLRNRQKQGTQRPISFKKRLTFSPLNIRNTQVQSQDIPINQEESVKNQQRKSSIQTKDTQNIDQILSITIPKSPIISYYSTCQQDQKHTISSKCLKKTSQKPVYGAEKMKNQDPHFRLSYKRLSYNQNTPNFVDDQFKKNCLRQTQVSDFCFLYLLGKGFNSIVYLAQHKSTKMLFAIKIISKDMLKNIKVKQNVFRQIKLHSFMHHPNVISMYKVISDQKYIYMILQYGAGGNLFNQLKKQKLFSQYKTAEIIRDVARALKYLHDNQIIHRDLKLQNIFINNKVSKLGDFGCAVYSVCMRKSSIGSPIYLSPQQLNNNLYGKKIDIWSLGVLTFQMLFGFSPFQKQITLILSKRQQGVDFNLKIPQCFQISKQARDFLSKCLQKHQNKRISIQSVIQHPFLTKYQQQRKFCR